MSNRVIYNVEYNIPRVNLSLPGRQNRSGDGILKLIPGIDEPIEFVFGNQDGVPINLLPFTDKGKVKIVFWVMETQEDLEQIPGQQKIIFSKELIVDQPHVGRIICLLTAEDTLRLAEEQTGAVRWGLFMINENGAVFPAEVNRNRKRYGTVQLDFDSGIPVAELIKSTNLR